jgi:glutamate synthase (NADPH/NADH) small chain
MKKILRYLSGTAFVMLLLCALSFCTSAADFTAPEFTEILGYENKEDRRDPKNGFVVGMKCIKMELGEPDERGRRRPVAIPDSEFVLDVDTVVMSIGTTPNPLIKSTTEGLEVNSRGGIIVTEGGATTKVGVFAGGDAVTGAATVISAMGAGKIAAKSIHEFISNK